MKPQPQRIDGVAIRLAILALAPTLAITQLAEPDLSQLSPDERSMIEAACNLDRRVNGPAAYYRCLNGQLQGLSRMSQPDLTGISAVDRSMIEAACNLDRRVNGPAAYYRCLDGQLQGLSRVSQPDLTGISAADRSMIEAACNLDRRVNGPAAYYRCLDGQLQGLSRVSRPDLTGISAADRSMIEAACNLDRRVNGPAAYYRCLNGQLNSLTPGGPVKSASTPARASNLASSGNAVASPPELVMPPTPPSAHEVDSSAASSTESRTQKPIPDSEKPTTTRTQRSAQTSAPTVTKETPPLLIPAPVSNYPATPVAPVSQPTPPGQGSSAIWTALLLVCLAGIVRVLTQKLRSKCPACGLVTAGKGLCEKCRRRDAERLAREAAEREAAQRAWAEEQYRQKRRQEEQRREEERRRLRTLEQLQRLTGREFEELIESLFAKDGYTVRRCGGSGDEGIDLILQIGQTKDAVQCKRWKADIGSPVVRDFYGALMHAGARHGFIITTASFSQSARSFAMGKPITLIAGADILRWLEGQYSSNQGFRQENGENASNGGAFDPYAVLGVSTTATKEDIRSAYRTGMSQYHPDKVAHLGIELQELARRKALELNRAYEMLGQ
jgi:restriction system protein